MTDLELFARLIQCEAGGEGDNGMKAVASVVMNRVRTSVGEYGRYNTPPSSIRTVSSTASAHGYLAGRTCKTSTI
mgnify:CR=1 FL=1